MRIQRPSAPTARDLMNEPQVYGTPGSAPGAPSASPRWRLLSDRRAARRARRARAGARALGLAMVRARTGDGRSRRGQRRRRSTHHRGAPVRHRAGGRRRAPRRRHRVTCACSASFAQRDGRGYALFRSSRGPLLASAGQDIGAGVRLEAVRPDGVTLIDGGARRDMPLRAANATCAFGAATGQGRARRRRDQPQVLGVRCARGLRRAHRASERRAPDRDDDDHRCMEGAARAGGGRAGRARSKRLRRQCWDSGTAIASSSANGIALAVPADIPAMVLQPLTRSQPVWLAGTRDGKPQQWLYLNAGACPG